MNAKRGFYNFFFSMIGQLITIAFGIFIPRLFLLSYGSEVNGLINSVYQVFVYLGLLEAGIGAAAIQALYKPVASDDKKAINSILSATDRYYKKISLAYFLAVIAFSLVYGFVLSSSIHSLVIVGVIFFIGMANVTNFLYQGKYKLLLAAEGKSYIVTNIQTLIFILTSLSKIACIYLGLNIVIIQAVFFMVNLVQILYIWLYIRVKYKWLCLHDKPDFSAISQKNYALVHQISGLVFQNTDVLILTIVCGLKVVSVYTIYKIIISMISNMVGSIGSSVAHVLGQTYSVDANRYVRLIDIFDVYFNALGFTLFSIVNILLLPFIKLYTQGITDIDYIDPLLPLLFVCIELFVVIRSGMLGTIVFAGHYKETVFQTIIESTINMTVSLFCVNRFGIYGVLSGTIVALFYRTNEMILYVNKTLLHRKALKSYSIYGINIMIFLFILLIIPFFNLSTGSYLEIAKTCLLLLFIIGAVYFSINSFIFRDEAKYVINYTHLKALNLMNRIFPKIVLLGKGKRIP